MTPTEALAIITADPANNRILECADAGQADYIVSGDAHLLELKQHGRIPILKVGRLPEAATALGGDGLLTAKNAPIVIQIHDAGNYRSDRR